MQPLIVLAAGHAVDADLQVPADQPLLERTRVGVEQLQLDPLVAGLHGADEIDQMGGRDRAHHAQLEGCALEPREVDRLLLDRLCLLVDLREIRQDHVAELGEMRVGALAVEQWATELLLEQLDRARQ